MISILSKIEFIRINYCLINYEKIKNLKNFSQKVIKKSFIERYNQNSLSNFSLFSIFESLHQFIPRPASYSSHCDRHYLNCFTKYTLSYHRNFIENLMNLIDLF